jgi:acyl-coenzyme A thioesterase PaaI-like protein
LPPRPYPGEPLGRIQLGMMKGMPSAYYQPYAGDDGGFAAHVGPLYIDERRVLSPRFAFLPGYHHANAAGVVHGGMLMTLSDQVLGLTVRANAGTPAVVTVSLTCQFVTAARPGNWIEGWAEIVHRAGSLIFIRGTLTSEGTPVMSSNGIWKQVREAAQREPSNR